uniref:(California timema) hypothetical protein n=1 Tax=Timema californicum TaxID=61474 RepID=A0A7R9PBZ9_TIMCA|nr:unnamed protein product [Timema californicum]
MKVQKIMLLRHKKKKIKMVVFLHRQNNCNSLQRGQLQLQNSLLKVGFVLSQTAEDGEIEDGRAYIGTLSTFTLSTRSDHRSPVRGPEQSDKKQVSDNSRGYRPAKIRPEQSDKQQVSDKSRGYRPAEIRPEQSDKQQVSDNSRGFRPAEIRPEQSDRQQVSDNSRGYRPAEIRPEQSDKQQVSDNIIFYVWDVFVEAECQPQAHTPKHNLGVSPPHNTGDTAKKHAAKKKLADGNESVKSNSKPKNNSKPKKTSTPKAKKIVQPITLDMTGRPVFPIVLGGLTIHSLGEVVSDRPDYHSEELIFPVGFCSSRMYGSLKDPEKNDCHTLLLHKINLSLGFEVVSTRGRGPEFFGFSHPTILNLIQSSPGTRKCASYKWSRFEVSKTGEPPTEERDAALSYEALQRSIVFAKSHLLTAKKEESQEQLMSNTNTTLRDLLMS